MKKVIIILLLIVTTIGTILTLLFTIPKIIYTPWNYPIYLSIITYTILIDTILIIIGNKVIASRIAHFFKSIYHFLTSLAISDKTSQSSSYELRSRHIPRYVRREVWRRDQGRCVECQSNINLEYDHIMPFSKGGSNTVRNIQPLFEKCNRRKYNRI